MSESTPRIKIACQRCHSRRVKCDRQDGVSCTKCLIAHSPCEPIISRRGRYSRLSQKCEHEISDTYLGTEKSAHIRAPASVVRLRRRHQRRLKMRQNCIQTVQVSIMIIQKTFLKGVLKILATALLKDHQEPRSYHLRNQVAGSRT